MLILAAGLSSRAITTLGDHYQKIHIKRVNGAQSLLDLLSAEPYDAVVIDIDATGVGLDVGHTLRSYAIATPLIGLANGVSQIIWGDQRARFLDLGGDDLLRNPVNLRELVASLPALIRRFRGTLSAVVEVHSQGVCMAIDVRHRVIRINGQQFDLTCKETSLLMLLATTPGQV
jgi:DNA-binding response OmpR family regulator